MPTADARSTSTSRQAASRLDVYVDYGLDVNIEPDLDPDVDRMNTEGPLDDAAVPRRTREPVNL